MDGSAGNQTVQIVERHWVENEGAPDSLLVFLSSGRDFTLRYVGDVCRVYERDLEISETDEEAITGLSRATLIDLGREVFVHHVEHQSEVE